MTIRIKIFLLVTALLSTVMITAFLIMTQNFEQESLLLVGVFLFGVFATYIISHRLTRWLNLLVDYARMLPTFDPTATETRLAPFLNASSIEPEIAQLAEAFLFMETRRRKNLRKIAVYRDHLEEQVQIRTRELSDINTQLQAEIQERQHVEAALRASETRYRELFNNINSGVAVYEVKGDSEDFIFKDFNRAGERIDGERREELIGRSIFDARPGVEAFGLIDIFRKVWRTGEPAVHPVTLYTDQRLTGWYENFVYKLPTGEIVAVFNDLTERKQLEEEHDRLIELSLDLICIAGMDGYFKKVNPAWEQVLGYTQEELLSRPFLHFIHPDDHPKNEQEMVHLAAGQPSLNFVNRYIHKNGSIRHISWKVVPDVHDQVMYGIGRDMTEQLRIEEQLRESERLLNFAIEQTSVPVIIANAPDVSLRCINRKAQDLLVKQPDDVFAMPLEQQREFWPTFYPDGDPYTPEDLPLTRAVKRGETSENVEIMLKKDRELHWLLVNAAPLFNDTGEIIAGIVVFPDITHLKQTEQALQASEQRLRMALDAAHAGVWELNLVTGEVWIDNNFRNMCEYAPEDLPPKLDQSLHHPKDWPQIQRKLHALQRGEITTYINEHRILTKTGTWKWVHAWAQVSEWNAQQTPLKIIGAAIDIDKRKRAEEERRQLLMKLEEKNKELEQIIYVTSHDLRSPLINIQGFSKELQHDLQDLGDVIQQAGLSGEPCHRLTELLEDIPEALHFILNSVSKMEGLLSGLLRLSRLGRAALSKEQLNMNTLLLQVLEEFEFAIKHQDIEIELEDVPDCCGDPTQLNQVFSNLLDNALKYLSSDRPGRIRISGRQDRSQVVYWVEDNGQGIDPAYQQHIFEIFHRLNPDQTEGEGLGLTIVERIIERHGGRIWVKSESGQGSTFFVALPAGDT